MDYVPALRAIKRYHALTQEDIVSHLPEGSAVTHGILGSGITGHIAFTPQAMRDITASVKGILGETLGDDGLVAYGAYVQQALLARDKYAPNALLALTFMAGDGERAYPNQPTSHHRALRLNGRITTIYPINVTAMGQATGIDKGLIHQLHQQHHEQKIPATGQVESILRYYAKHASENKNLPFLGAMGELQQAAKEWDRNPVGAELHLYRIAHRFIVDSGLELPSIEIIPESHRHLGAAIKLIRTELQVGQGDMAGMLGFSVAKGRDGQHHTNSQWSRIEMGTAALDHEKKQTLLTLLGVANEEALMALAHDISILNDARMQHVQASFARLMHQHQRKDERMPGMVRRLGLPVWIMDGKNFTGSVASVAQRVDALSKAGIITSELELYPDGEQARLAEIMERIMAWKAALPEQLQTIEHKHARTRHQEARR